MLKTGINHAKFSLTGQYYYDFNDSMTGFYAEIRKHFQGLLI